MNWNVITRIMVMHSFWYPTKHTFSIYFDLHKKAIKRNDAVRWIIDYCIWWILKTNKHTVATACLWSTAKGNSMKE